MIMKQHVCLRLCISVFSLFIVFSSWAETDANSEQALSELSPDVLIVRAQQLEGALNLIYQRVSGFTQNAQEVSVQLEANAIEREALAVPELPEAVSARAGTEAVQSSLTAWDEHLQQLAVLQGLLESRLVLAKQHREIALKLTNEYRLVEQARQQAAPLLTLLQQRISEQAITLNQLPDNLQALLTAQAAEEKALLVEEMANAGTVASGEQITISAAAIPTIPNAALTLTSLLTQPMEAENRWRAEIERDGLLLTEADEALSALRTQQEQAQQLQASMAVSLQEANYRDNLQTDFASRDLADLTALLVMQAEDWRTADEVAKEQNQHLLTKLDSLKETQQAFQEATPPKNIDFSVEEKNKALKAVKEAALIAEATLKFRTARHKELSALHANTVDLLKFLTDQMSNVDSIVNQTIELDVLSEVVTNADINLPDSIDVAYIAERLQTLQQRQQEFKAAQQQLNELSTALENSIAEAEQAIVEAEQNLAQRQELLSYEERWASFLNEVESQTTSELLTTFEDTLGAYQGIQEQLQAMQIKVDISQYMLDGLKTHADELHNPMVLEQIQATKEFTTWREDSGIHITALVKEDALAEAEQDKAPQVTVAPPIEAETPATVSTTMVEDSNAIKTPADLTKQSIQSVRQLRDRMVSRNLLALQEQGEAVGSLLAAYHVHLENLQLQQQVLQQSLELARRAWGSATALQTRNATEGGLDNLPAEVSTWTSRELVLNLQKQIEELKQQSLKVEKQQTTLAERQFGEGFLTALVDWEANLTRQISQLKERQEREQNYTPPDPATMDDFEKRRYERQVKERIDAEGTWLEQGLALFVSKQIEDTSKLLQAYYEKLLGLEYRYNNLQQRKEKTDALTKLTVSTRDLFAIIINTLQPVVNKAKQNLEVKTTQVKAVLYPSQTAELLADLKEKTGVTLTPSDLPQLPPSLDEAAYQEAQNALIDSLLEPWAEYVAYGEWLDWFKQQQVKLGGIDTQVNQLKETIASLDSTQKELQQQLAKLSGFSAETIEAMPVEEQPTTKQMREKMMLGEIGVLRKERLLEMQWEASKTLIWLLVIPIIAFIAIHIVTMLGRRAVARARVLSEQDGSRDRVDRISMLVHVFNIAWKILVILLSLIYIFKAVNIDVMPILASAGVLGLAIAFGAQQLVRDFFSGFFILLENQFRVGDTVIINNLSGKVERITPRITMVRSTSEGSLHYIPNGSINHVSNNSRELGVVRVSIPVSHQAKPEAVLKCLQQAIGQLQAHPTFGSLIHGCSNRGIEGFGELAIEYSVEICCKAGEQWELGREFRRLAKDLLTEADIEIPSLASLSGVPLGAVQEVIEPKLP